jgi:hypothetical protein
MRKLATGFVLLVTFFTLISCSKEFSAVPLNNEDAAKLELVKSQPAVKLFKAGTKGMRRNSMPL